MYKEKIINYVNKTDNISFIIKVPEPDVEEYLDIKFVKDGDKYYVQSTPCQPTEDGKFTLITGATTEQDDLDILPEEVLKIFVDKWEQMIVEQYLDNK